MRWRFGASRFGSSLSILDYLHIGSAMSLRSFGRMGARLSCLDFVHIGSSLSVRGFARHGSPAAPRFSQGPEPYMSQIQSKSLWCSTCNLGFAHVPNVFDM